MELWNLFYFVFRLVSMIIWISVFVGCCFLMPIKTLPFPVFSRVALYLLGFNLAPHKGVPDPEARMLITNHPGCHTDGMIWCAGLPYEIGFVARSNGMIVARKIIHAFDKHRKCVLVSYTEKENTVQRMKDFLKQYPDKKIMIAAEGGNASQFGFVPGAKLLKFRTGGFRVIDRVQPVLIRSVEPVLDTPRTVNQYVSYMWRHRNDPPVTLYIEYLPSVERKQDESVEDFTERVRQYMQNHIDNPQLNQEEVDKEEDKEETDQKRT